MTFKKKWKLAAAIIVTVVAAVAVFLMVVSPNGFLVLQNNTTGEEYARYPLREGQRFSIEFIHSVNQSPVIDIYEVRDGEIYVVETIYYHFGAGVQTELLDGQRFYVREDGAMVITDINQKIPHLSYMVGTWSDHILKINEQEISLRTLCGRSSKVHFSYERSIL